MVSLEVLNGFDHQVILLTIGNKDTHSLKIASGMRILKGIRNHLRISMWIWIVLKKEHVCFKQIQESQIEEMMSLI